MTFEERRDGAWSVAGDMLWLDSDEDLESLVTDDEEIEVEGERYRALKQPSSGTYFGPWGSHFVEEKLYRSVDVRNGPTVKPIELRAGIEGTKAKAKLSVGK